MEILRRNIVRCLLVTYFKFLRIPANSNLITHSIPENYIQGRPLWQRRQTWKSCIMLDNIDADIGHTIRISYTRIQSDACRAELEYKRNIQVYYGATNESLLIFQILRGVRIIFSKLSDENNDPMFSKAVMKMIVGLFAVQWSWFRNPPEATDSGSEACPEPESEPAEEYDGEPCPEVLSQLCIPKITSALHQEHPCEKSSIELVPVESEEATPKVHYEHAKNDAWDWSFARSQPPKQSLAQKEAQREVQA
ncbi:hypothetical protein BDW59DRAFT_175194 [Aspergillus cavernicola]|uniref:Uncharacterized protein n=1 Tax=Aspergillus cavernicola TaxID=176166 RepID=A0ABR4HRU7_9EURO